jgi:hypothetical protein
VPAENATFPVENDFEAGKFDLSSAAHAQILILGLNLEAIEAGITAEENLAVLMGEAELPEGIVPVEIHKSMANADRNETGTGTRELSGTVTIAPGDSVWLFAIVQSLGANGAVISGSLETSTTITGVAKPVLNNSIPKQQPN